MALVGGGSDPRPGEISLAHHGVLFLDELPEWDRRVLEVLREPLESGQIHISRAARQAIFPARFQFVAAMNPCPCGYLGHPTGKCRCSPDQIARYRSRISGPLLDRIDLQIEVPSLPVDALPPRPGRAAEASAAVRGRVVGLFLTIAGTFSSTAPWVMGWWTDRLGGRATQPSAYLPIFGALALMMLAACGALPLIGYRRLDRMRA